MPGLNIITKNVASVPEKLIIMREDAAFDVADNEETGGAGCENIPDLSSVRSIRGKASPPKVPKMFLSNDCTFNCAYCGCRATHDERARYCNKPADLAKMAVAEAASNGRGVFISSAIHKNADYTEELIVETLRIMRKELHYGGYIHAKVMPGADPLLIYRAGQYANRLSVNIEVAKNEGFEMIAKQKNRSIILTPMAQISGFIKAAAMERAGFATSQSTQLMAGGSNEDDRTIMVLSEAMYRKYRLKRVYYTPFQYKRPARGYEGLPLVSTPHWRMVRLYQADRLLQLYGFTPDDVTPDVQPFLEEDIDPKAGWALRNLDKYPVEVNTADYETLLRVPGIGVTYAKRIIEARRLCRISHETLKRIGVALKRCRPFITCKGKYEGISFDDELAVRKLLSSETDFKQLELEAR